MWSCQADGLVELGNRAYSLRRYGDMKKPDEPSEASIEEMPEIDDQRFRRRPGRGHRAARDVGEIVTIDADLWTHFGSAEVTRYSSPGSSNTPA